MLWLRVIYDRTDKLISYSCDAAMNQGRHSSPLTSETRDHAPPEAASEQEERKPNERQNPTWIGLNMGFVAIDLLNLEITLVSHGPASQTEALL